MAARSQNKKKKSAQPGPVKKNRRKPVLVLLLLFSCVLGAGLWFFVQKGAIDRSPKEFERRQSQSEDNSAVQRSRDYQYLIGRWVRPDGGYVIEIRGINTNGEMDVGYFNPRPINVSRAQVSQGGQGTVIFIELNDVGYPGATYNLAYHLQKDLLLGFYYQPSAKQTFEVVFVRKP